jgi:hypothetical protein
MRIEVRGIQSDIEKIRRELDVQINKLADEIQTRARSNTPIKTGNARKGWKKQKEKDGYAVVNRVPYIERLEAGASRQAPKGIIGPTLTQIKGR